MISVCVCCAVELIYCLHIRQTTLRLSFDVARKGGGKKRREYGNAQAGRPHRHPALVLHSLYSMRTCSLHPMSREMRQSSKLCFALDWQSRAAPLSQLAFWVGAGAELEPIRPSLIASSAKVRGASKHRISATAANFTRILTEYPGAKAQTQTNSEVNSTRAQDAIRAHDWGTRAKVG